MKKVGILLRDYISESHNPLLGIRSDLIRYLRNYNVQVHCIPVCFDNNEFDEFERVVEDILGCDGIILPGGKNDYEIDLKIAKYLHENNIPTLGICLGMQIMALSFEGDINYLNNGFHQSKNDYVHNVKIKNNSKLYEILGINEISVNSRHSDHITTTDLSITAISDDLVIEAVEDPSKTFYIGVQWHPESLMNDEYSKKIFDYFINLL